MHTVDPTPLRTPTIVVVRAELTMVHKNMVKLRTMPITNERIRITKKYKELLCILRKNLTLDINAKFKMYIYMPATFNKKEYFSLMQQNKNKKQFFVI